MKRAPWRSWLSALRPKQWTKNLVVFAAFLFALGDQHQAVNWPCLGSAALASLVFCVVSSGVYLLNDVLDLARDRAHPIKRHRPLAAGEIQVPAATAAGLVLLGIGLACAWALHGQFAVVVGAYILLQAAYSLLLKQVAFLDVLLIAAGFVLRALAGAVVLNVTISPWLLFCTGLLALFLALCKRRHEKVVLDGLPANVRPSLGRFTTRALDVLIAATGVATALAYALYTVWPDTVEKFGTHRLAWTLPFVLFGIGRYLHLVYRRAQGDRPEQILLTDWPLLASLAFYGISVLWILLG